MPFKRFRPRGCGGRARLLPLKMLLSGWKYRRKAQLLSAVPFCVLSHTKLCCHRCSALCYYDRKKWISNEVSVPAASTLWISVAQELCQPALAKCEPARGRTRLSKHSPCEKPFSVQIQTNRNTLVSLISYAVTCPHFTVIDSRDRKGSGRL